MAEAFELRVSLSVLPDDHITVQFYISGQQTLPSPNNKNKPVLRKNPIYCDFLHPTADDGFPTSFQLEESEFKNKTKTDQNEISPRRTTLQDGILESGREEEEEQKLIEGRSSASRMSPRLEPTNCPLNFHKDSAAQLSVLEKDRCLVLDTSLCGDYELRRTNEVVEGLRRSPRTLERYSVRSQELEQIDLVSWKFENQYQAEKTECLQRKPNQSEGLTRVPDENQKLGKGDKKRKADWRNDELANSEDRLFSKQKTNY